MDEQESEETVKIGVTFKKKNITAYIVGGSLFLMVIIAGVSFYAGRLTGRNTQVVINPKVSPSPIETRSVTWRTYKVVHETQFGYPDYEIKLPDDWEQQTHSSNFQDMETFTAPDKSSVRINIFDNPEKNLDKFLIRTDKEKSTGWEGMASVEVKSQKNGIVGMDQISGIERLEDWLAAGFTTQVTYVNVGDKVITFMVVPDGIGTYSEQTAAKYYDQILASFKLTDNKVTPAISAKLLSTAGWKTAGNGIISLKYPDEIYTFETGKDYVQFRKKGNSANDMSNSPGFVIANDYTGGSRREWFINHYSYYANEAGKNFFINEKILGTLPVLEVTLTKGGEVHDIVVVINGKLIDILPQGADLKTIETMVSTLTSPN